MNKILHESENLILSKYYHIEQISPSFYTIYDPLGVYSYLIVGTQKALLFDTGHGIAPLHDVITSVCSLPYDVVLSHGHWDHCAGAYQFDKVWLHPADKDLCLRQFHKETRNKIASMYHEEISKNAPDFDLEAYLNIDALKQPTLLALEHGQVFELGDISVEIIAMDGHTAGSIGILIREMKHLLTGDAANKHTWMFLEDSLPVHIYIDMLKRVSNLDFETMQMSHDKAIFPKSDIGKYLQVAQHIDMEKASPYDYNYETLGGYLFEEDGFGIVFNPNNL